jgi:hypothetical protein
MPAYQETLFADPALLTGYSHRTTGCNCNMGMHRSRGNPYYMRLRRKTPSGNDLWQLDEIVITIVGRKHWPWRGGDQDGYVLDEIVHNRRTT